MNLATICRFCLIESNTLTEITKITMQTCEMCLCIPIRTINGSKICQKCLNFFEKMCNFKLMCMESENQIVDILYEKQQTELLPTSFDKIEEPTLKENVPSVNAESVAVTVYDKKEKRRPKKSRKEISKEARIKAYLSTRDTIVQCDICGKQLKFNSLKYHRKKHDIRTNFECDLCGKKITNKPTLRRHIESFHLRIQKVFCPLCPGRDGFVDQTTLSAHHSVHHGTKYVCSVCGTEKKTKFALKRHTEIVHDKIKKYRCSYCGCAYSSERGLQYHEATAHKGDEKLSHFGELMATCVCRMQFFSRKSFRSHIDENHKEQDGRWKCPEPCSRYYSRRVKLVDHFKLYHKIPYEAKKLMRAAKEELDQRDYTTTF